MYLAVTHDGELLKMAALRADGNKRLGPRQRIAAARGAAFGFGQ
jgi:hypothetical protein